MSRLKLIDILKEESILNTNKEILIKKLKNSLIDLFPNTDLNLFLQSFYDEYPNSETKKYFTEFDDYGPDIFDIDKHQFMSIMSSSEMMKFLNNQLEKPTIKNILSKIKNDGTIEIFRSITVDKDWFKNLKLKKLKRLGIYWSWNGGYAAYSEDKEYDVELISIIDEKFINWSQTIIQNIMYDGSEDEITLFKNTPLRLIRVMYKKRDRNMMDSPYDEIESSIFKNDIFYS